MNGKKDNRRKITSEQADQVVSLYESGRYSIKEILSITGISSSQTIYRILSARNEEKKSRPVGMRKTIAFDIEATEIIHRENPRNLSGWISRLVKEAYKK